LVIWEAEAEEAIARAQNGEMKEKRNRKKEEILRRIVAFDWAEDVDLSPSTENEPIIPTRPTSADPRTHQLTQTQSWYPQPPPHK
jgi:hypothetical protein